MIYDDYIEYVRKYKEEYGENTVVLMQVGSFYEAYTCGSGLVNLKALGELLNLQVTRRNKAILEVSKNNLEMMGFPAYILGKYVNILVQNNFTCVIVSQTTPPPNPKREVTDIISPGTYVSDEIQSDTNYLMSIYSEEFLEYKTNKPSLTVGASLIDLGTGKTFVFETSSRNNDIYYPLDELYRIVVSYNPREIILCGKYNNHETSLITYDKMVKYLDIEHKCVHNDYSKCNNELAKLSYQEEVLRRIYPKTGLLSCVEFLGLERKPCAQLSYVRLVQFVFNHNEQVLEKIHVPNVLEESNTLILSYNSVKQLDMVSSKSSPNSKSFCLFDILNNCQTAVGRRYFKERLLSPLTNTKILEYSYDTIKLLVNTEDTVLKSLKTDLSSIYDIERLFRKVVMGTIQPFELGYIVSSMKHLKNTCATLSSMCCTESINECVFNDIENACNNVCSAMQKQLEIDELLKYNMDNISPKIFKRGVHETLDKLSDELEHNQSFLNKLLDGLNGIVGENVFKLETNERDGFHFLITSKRFQEFLKQHKGKTVSTEDGVVKISELVSKAVSQTSTSVKITLPKFKTISERAEVLTLRLRRLVTEAFKNFTSAFSIVTSEYAINLTKYLAYIDFYWCNATNAIKYRYSQPHISNLYESKSFLNATALRHPIIERLNDDIRYVSNDISLGTPGCDGVLLYGLNSSGKSSLMKSIGIAVVMAQAGMYVACDAFEYYPYEYVFTRIFSSDDIFKGQSTFTKEMMELRGILRRANSNSLVLGDELCSGTESISALSIVSAGVHTLASKKSSFIFATHLHDLIKIPLVKELRNVETMHLSVEYDVATKRLIYDRKLKSGNGSSLYGLEVCKALDIDSEFLELANTIRQGILNVERGIVSTTSNNNKYNKGIYKDICQVCNENKATEVHHIAQQKDANEQGYIENFHKNDKFNLVCLCDICHDKVHHGNLEINGFKQTGDGVILDFVVQTQEDNVEEVDYTSYIRTLLTSNPVLKRKEIIKQVNEQYGDGTVSTYKIDKALKEIKK